MDRKLIFSIFLILNLTFLLFLFQEKSHAGLFGDDVPEGKEIKDPYIEKLFAPQYPYEWIKVIDTKEGKRHVVIKGRETVTKQMEKEYEKNTLRKRNIVIYRYYSPRNNQLIVARIRLSRKVTEKPYVIEYCEATPWPTRDKEKNIAWRAGKYFVLWIDKEFGKKFKTLTIYPNKEVACPEPPFVGKYPNSITLGCTRQTFIKPSQPYYKKGQSRVIFTYVSKDASEKIYDFYKNKLLDHFRNVGFNLPENFWQYNHEFGIQVPHIDIYVLDRILSSLEDKYILDGVLESNSLIGNPPAGGVVFNIKISRGELAENLIKEYSWIRIYYDFEPNVIQEKMRMGSKGGGNEIQ